MNLKLDNETYDEYQSVLMADIVDRIRVKLIEAGMEGDQLHNVTGDIAFSIVSAIDDMAMIERDGVQVRPYLAFRGEGDEIIHCGENSCLAEFIDVAMNEVFSE